jgi:hypothetical protein
VHEADTVRVTVTLIVCLQFEGDNVHECSMISNKRRRKSFKMLLGLHIAVRQSGQCCLLLYTFGVSCHGVPVILFIQAAIC